MSRIMVTASVSDDSERAILRSLGASLLTLVQENAQKTIVKYWNKYQTRNQIDEDTENAKILDLEEQLEEALEEIEELKDYEKSIKSDRDKWEEKYHYLRSVTREALELADYYIHNSYGDYDEYNELESKLDWIDNN